MQKSDMQFLHISVCNAGFGLGVEYMYNGSADEQPSFNDSLWANIVIPLLALMAIGAGGWYFFGDYFSRGQGDSVADSSALCVDENILNVVAEKASLAVANRTDTGPWENGSQRLRTVDEFVNRLTLSQISFHGYSKVGGKVGCWTTVTMAPPEADFQNDAYDKTARVMFSIQNTMDGSDPVVSLENDHELTSRASQWAKAEVVYDPTVELTSALGAWKDLDEEMKATADERNAQLQRKNAKTDVWNKRYAEVFDRCTESSEECQQRARTYADGDETVEQPSPDAPTE
jgi:hypothetical protein